MNIAVDLHIHSGLSPCADKDMTPNNIVNMACLKGLDAIAVTDHNSTRNLPSIAKVAEKNNLILIPGIEVTSREEVHLLALFVDLAAALDFQRLLDASLPQVENKARVFGNQYVYDEEDRIIDEIKVLLLNAVNLSIEDVIREVRDRGGIVIPAHVNRESFSIITNLGFISSHLGFSTIEITGNCEYDTLEKLYPYLREYKKLRSSDAHNLSDILEREVFIEVEEQNISSIINALKGKP